MKNVINNILGKPKENKSKKISLFEKTLLDLEADKGVTIYYKITQETKTILLMKNHLCWYYNKTIDKKNYTLYNNLWSPDWVTPTGIISVDSNQKKYLNIKIKTRSFEDLEIYYKHKLELQQFLKILKERYYIQIKKIVKGYK